MSSDVFPIEVVPHEDFQLHIRELAGDALIDFAAWTFNFVGIAGDDPENRLFAYTLADGGVIEPGSYTLEDNQGANLEYNLRITVPHTKTAEFDNASYQNILIGLLATPASGSPIQILKNLSVFIAETIAP